MNEQAGRNVDLDCRNLAPRRGRQLKALDDGRNRGVDRVPADLAHEQFRRIETLGRDAQDLAGLVLDAQDDHAAVAVGKSSDFVREGVATRLLDLSACQAHFLQLQIGVLAQADLVEKFALAIEHRPAPVRGGGSDARRPPALLP